MKKVIISALSAAIMGAFATNAHAENILEVYQLAAQNDPLIQTAKARYESAVRGLDVSRSVLLPQINATASYSDSDIERDDKISGNSGDNAFETTTLGINLVQEIYHHDSWVNYSRTEKVVKQAELSFQTEEQNLIVRTVQAYLDILSARDDAEFVRAEKKAIERQLEQTKQRFEVGLTAITDVHEAQAQYDNAVAEEITAENEVILTLENLRAITGQYVDRLDTLNTEMFAPKLPTPNKADGWIEIAKNLNKELLSRRLGKDIAKQDIDIATAGHYPEADLTVGYQVQETEGDSFSSQFGASLPADFEDDGLTWGVQINVPIFSGGRTSAQVEQAQFDFVAASQELEFSYRSTERDVRNSFNQLKASISRISALKQTVVSAESALKATEAGFEVGTRTIVDVLDSTRNLFDAKRNLSFARYNFILASLALKQAAGNLSADDLTRLNRFLSAEKA